MDPLSYDLIQGQVAADSFARDLFTRDGIPSGKLMHPGKLDGEEATPAMWMAAALLMLIPIVMVVLSLIVPHPAIRWIAIVAAVFLVLFNLAGLPYDGAYDNFLIVFSFIFNALIVWYAWRWTAAV